jgi:hypothetical protein
MYHGKRTEKKSDTLATKPRPYWGPKQVRSRNELMIGQSYLYVHSHINYNRRITLVSEPFMTEYGWRVMYRTQEGYEQCGSLADMGIEPMSTGDWNSTNYLLHLPDMKPQRKSEIAIESAMPNQYIIYFYASDAAAKELAEFGSLQKLTKKDNYKLDVDRRYDFNEVVEFIKNYKSGS